MSITQIPLGTGHQLWEWGGGGAKNGGGGDKSTLTPTKRRVRKPFSHADGGWHTGFWVVLMWGLPYQSFSHTEGGRRKFPFFKKRGGGCYPVLYGVQQVWNPHFPILSPHPVPVINDQSLSKPETMPERFSEKALVWMLKKVPQIAP